MQNNSLVYLEYTMYALKHHQCIYEEHKRRYNTFIQVILQTRNMTRQLPPPALHMTIPIYTIPLTTPLGHIPQHSPQMPTPQKTFPHQEI